MPEYLAPGVYVEETSYRSKSIEGVSTTTTGFVGPARFGPVDMTPEVVTSVTEFERTYGDKAQLDFGAGMILHNYLWHAMRAFFEEGGKRLYVVRVFQPAFDPQGLGYRRPAEQVGDDLASLTQGVYGADGHARRWLTPATLAAAALVRRTKDLAAATATLTQRAERAAEAGLAQARHAGNAAPGPDDRPALAAALGLRAVVGDNTAGAETGLGRALADVVASRAAALPAFDDTDLGDTEAAYGELLQAAADAAADAGSLSAIRVWTPAANAAVASATAASAAGGALAASAQAVADAAAASPALKLLAASMVASLGNTGAAQEALAQAQADAAAVGQAAAGANGEVQAARDALVVVQAQLTSLDAAAQALLADPGASTPTPALLAHFDTVTAGRQRVLDAIAQAQQATDDARDPTLPQLHHAAHEALATVAATVTDMATAAQVIAAASADPMLTLANALQSAATAAALTQALQDASAATLPAANRLQALASSSQALQQVRALRVSAQALGAQAAADGATPLAAPLARVMSDAEALETAALEAQQRLRFAIYPRAHALEQVLNRARSLVGTINALDSQVTAVAEVVLATPPQGDRSGAALLRARFPGAAGNLRVRFTARMGQSVLVADESRPNRTLARGLLAGDLVWICPRDQEGHLFTANPTEDGTDWYFSVSGAESDARFWLNRADSATATRLAADRHELRIVSATVEVLRMDGTGSVWDGLSFQPGHKRNGAADGISDKFAHGPSSGSDARTLPFELLLHPTLNTGSAVLGMLMQRDPAVSSASADWPLVLMHQLSGGNDGQRPGAAEYAGRGDGPDAPKSGLKAFEDIEDISIVAAPGSTYLYNQGYRRDATQIIASLISHAEGMRYRVAVLDSGDAQGIQDVRAMRARIDSKYAAFYYPWVKVLDPYTRAEIHVPPSGFVAGIYARNDIERAVYKAPANEVVRSAIGFETLLNKAQQDVLNPENINCFRYFEGRGLRLWGARTASSDPEWKYISVRRYFAYVERSIDRGTQWAVFEPNGDRLWANVRETIADFLYNEWRNGALLGTRPDKAYFVRCDASTMSQNDLDNGRLVCLIGLAVVKPAEFVIFRIGQWTADRKV